MSEIGFGISTKGLSEARQTLLSLYEMGDNILFCANVNTAEKIRDAEVAAIGRVFDRPTPFILNGMRIVTKQSSGEVSVTWKDKLAAGHAKITHLGETYSDVASTTLVPEIQGGGRAEKGLEYRLRAANVIAQNEWVMPSNNSPILDQYGNMKGPQVGKMISDLQAYHERIGSHKKAFNTNAGNIRYFINMFIWKHSGKKYIFKSLGAHDAEIAAIVTNKKPEYKELFDFYGIAETAYGLAFDEEFNRVFDRIVTSDKQVRCVPRKAKQGQGT